jgi:hypothetical protein
MGTVTKPCLIGFYRRRKKGGAKERKKKPPPKKSTSVTEVAKEKKRTSAGTKSLLVKQESLPNSQAYLPKIEQEVPQPRQTRSRSSGSVWYKTSERCNDNSSGLFLYIDMHGHTTKRGKA